MTVQPEISAIVPIHNWSSVSDNISELLKQKEIVFFKVIFILDSCDPEAEIELKRLLISTNNVSYIVLIRNFSSAAKSRNEGLEIVKTEWLCFWDSDDLPNLRGFLDMYSHVSNSDIDLAVGQIRTIYIREGEEVKRKLTKTQSLFMLAMDLGFTRILYRSLFIKNLFFLNYKSGEDVIFLAKLISRKPKIFFSNVLVYRYLNANWILKKSGNSTINELHLLHAKLCEDQRMQQDGYVKGFYLILIFKLLLSISKRIVTRDLPLTINTIFKLFRLLTVRNFYHFYKLLAKRI
jgi:hypothetical protein